MIGRIVGLVMLVGVTKCVWSGATLMDAAADAADSKNGPQQQYEAVLAAIDHYESEPRMKRHLRAGTDACLREWADGERVPDGMRRYYRDSVAFVFRNGRAVRRDPKGMLERARTFDAKARARANRTLMSMPKRKRESLWALEMRVGKQIGGFMNCVTEEASRLT